MSLNAISAHTRQTRALCPPGQLNQDVTYAQVYAFLSCLQVSALTCCVAVALASAGSR